jgi:tetratricopeptide (TPR) repeat protein
MPKSRHPKRKHKNKPKSLLLNLSKELDKVEDLIQAGNLSEALDQLHELAERAPHRAEIFETIFLVAVQLDDKHELLDATIRLVELQPYVPAHYFNLYGAYRQNLFPALAVQTGRHFLSRWPDLALGKDIREGVDELSGILRNEATKMQLPEDSWLEVMALHERVQVALSRGRYEEARRLATQLIPLAPNFVSPYNNRSLAAWAEGDAEAAIADARRVLEIEPHNVHALSNLTRFLRLTNHPDEAREIAERLKTAASPQLDVWTKKAEAFSYLANDAAVLEIAEQAEEADAPFGKYADPILLHLAGVAAARLGGEKRAREFWREALKRSPSLSRAQANLADLDKPPGERDGPWAFEISDWLSPSLYKDFKNMAGAYSDHRSRSRQSQTSTCAFAGDHAATPEICFCALPACAHRAGQRPFGSSSRFAEACQRSGTFSL